MGQDLASQIWRLNNLYWIQDKAGLRVPFRMNWAQQKLYDDRDLRNVILKARQLGFSTFIDLYILDCCLFRPDTKAGIIAHTLPDAEAIFSSKIKYPYDNLPDPLKNMVSADTSRSNMMSFSNGSSVRVSTSYRSGTLQILHVSEFGKISVANPARAIEIVTGAFEAVGLEQSIFVESTAEGRGGEFYNLVKRAQDFEKTGKTPTPLDWKFHFYAWWQESEYVLDPNNVTITQAQIEYFNDLRKRGIEISEEQGAWYAKKQEIQGDKITREYPSYPEEAFEAAIKGAYYGVVIKELRDKKRICRVPYDPLLPVHTAWDLGMDDYTCIWFFQCYGTERRIIDCYQNNGEAIAHYARVLSDKKYNYGSHYLPHDARARSLQTNKTTVEIAESCGIYPVVVVKRAKNEDELLAHIEKTRQFLALAWIDEANCADGLVALENYRKAWDERLGCFKSRPLHDEYSHYADALRTGAAGYIEEMTIDDDDLVPDYAEDF